MHLRTPLRHWALGIALRLAGLLLVGFGLSSCHALAHAVVHAAHGHDHHHHHHGPVLPPRRRCR